MRAYEISKMTAHTKRAINDDVNSLLLGTGLNKRIATGNNKEFCALKLDIPEDKKRSKDRSPFKVWKMMTRDAKAVLCQGNKVNIGLVKDNAAKMVRPGGRGGCPNCTRRVGISS